MSIKANSNNFSSVSKPVDGELGNPFAFPSYVGTAAVLGGGLYFGRVEEILVGLSANAKQVTTVLGAASITFAHGHAIIYNANARREFQVPQPISTCEKIAFLNGTRGYYNLVEHIPFFILNFVLCRETSPCIAGVLATVFGLGRMIYTQGYAMKGPPGRATGFMIATFSSMACLGVVAYDNMLGAGKP